MEKLVHQRLYVFFENSNVLHDKQFVFRNKHSTTHALTEITEKTREALDIFIDPPKTSDTINHDILLDKLNYYGVNGDLKYVV